MSVLVGAAVVTPTGLLEDGWVHVADGLIAGVGSGAPPPGPRVDLAGGVLLPGLLDLHCHGGGGADLASADPAEIARAAREHLRHGSTGLLASLVSAPVEALCAQLAAVADVVEAGGSTVLGSHLEGPFLSGRRCGAQDPDALLLPDADVFARLVTAARGTLRMITLAPELPGALQLIDAAVDAGVVVAVGHTDASYEQAAAAFSRGATVATHLFNGMRPLHHRDPGPVLAALDAGAACEVVNDGVHLHPAVVGSLGRAAPSRLVLVTDAIAAAGAGDGELLLGRLPVRVVGGEARLVSGGALAGSTLTMDRAVTRARDVCGLPWTTVATASSGTPAGVLGLQHAVGSLSRGLRADLVHLGTAGVVTVFRAGHRVR